jgi:hypothetical protein
MTTVALRRIHVPFWLVVGTGIIAWLIAWFLIWPVSQWLAFGLLGLEPGSPTGEAVAFFLFDLPKVLLLLVGVVTLVSFLRSFVSPDRVRRTRAGRHERAPWRHPDDREPHAQRPPAPR